MTEWSWPLPLGVVLEGIGRVWLTGRRIAQQQEARLANSCRQAQKLAAPEPLNDGVNLRVGRAGPGIDRLWPSVPAHEIASLDDDPGVGVIDGPESTPVADVP